MAWSRLKVAGNGGVLVPPAEVSNVKVVLGNSVAKFTWKDPTDIFTEEVNVNEWAGTTIVLNTSHIPKDQNDGDVIATSRVRDEHVTEPVITEKLVDKQKYYYGIFPFSVHGVYNINPEQTGEFTVIASPELKPTNEYTWEEIANIAKIGRKSDDGNHFEIDGTVYFTKGDETAPVNMGADGTIVAVMEAFEHDDLADGSGKAPISFLLKTGLKNKRQMNSSSTNSGGMPATQLHRQLQNEIFNEIVDGPKPYIKEVKKKCSKGNELSQIISYNAKLWIPTEIEMFGSTTYSAKGEGQHYTRYTNNQSRIKKVNGSADIYWLASPYVSHSSYFCSVYSDGSADWYYASFSCGVVVGFCI